MQLSKQALHGASTQAQVSEESIFSLPEKVLQFGSGVLLRGLIDYFIDKANKAGEFNGRIVVVHSIETEPPTAFAAQDFLYTHCLRGIHQGELQEQVVVNAAISRILRAIGEWDEVMEYASSETIETIISNTTEAGIVLDESDDLSAAPPRSFPGKLLALLYRRYQHFRGDMSRGWNIVPAELISSNGDKLRDIMLQLANINQLGDEFCHWLLHANRYCNTLVDRIVPGRLPAAEQQSLEQKLGYSDAFTIMSEPYSLWAIESESDRLKQELSFAKANPGVIICPDIHKYKELKLRLLNGTHTFVCGLAVLCGLPLVRTAMQHPPFRSLLKQLMFEELVPVVATGDISRAEAEDFARSVIERFDNPFIDHQWLSITLNYTYKMENRNLELILARLQQQPGEPFQAMAFCFAAYLLFMRCEANADGSCTGEAAGQSYVINDSTAAWFAAQWQQGPEALVQTVFSDKFIWGASLAQEESFAQAVTHYLMQMIQQSPEAALESFVNKQAVYEAQGIESASGR